MARPTGVLLEGSVSVERQAGPEIENLLAESRTFPPDPAFVAQANATAALYEEAEADYVGFWARQARERLSWFTEPTETLEWDLPFAKWFTGGKLNVTYNCVDRHVEAGLRHPGPEPPGGGTGGTRPPPPPPPPPGGAEGADAP